MTEKTKEFMQQQQRDWILQQMGITVWQDRAKQNTVNDLIHGDILQSHESIDDNAWQKLQQQVAGCQACPLHQSRTHTVFGVGNNQADIMIVGEAPGAQEDKQGEPFVGRAGLLLNSMLQAIGLQRQQIFICNILKCRPPNNRDPKPEETELCTRFLTQQIAYIQPKVILAVGRISAQYLLGSNLSLGRLRRQLHHYGELKTPLIVTYHPAYLLRSPRDKAKSYEDLLWLRDLLS